MTLLQLLPTEARKYLEKHGIEQDDFSRNEHDIFIEIDDIEVAFELREIMLQYFSCCLITHPTSRKPTLMIHKILTK